MSMEDVVELSSQDPDANGDVQHQTFSYGSEASEVVTKHGSGQAIAELRQLPCRRGTCCAQPVRAG